MKKKNNKTRSKNEKLAIAAKTFKLRRCEIRLRRFSINAKNAGVNLGVDSKESSQNNSQVLLQVQQNITKNKQNSNKQANGASNKAANNVSHENESIDERNLLARQNSSRTQNLKVRKCVVKLKKMQANKENNINLSSVPSDPVMCSSTIGIEVPFPSKCVVKLRNNKNADSDQQSNVRRDPKLALTKRRAEEIGLKEPTKINVSSQNDTVSPESALTKNRSEESSLSPPKTISPRNLANRPNDITELLLCEDEPLLENDKSIPNKDVENVNKQTIKHKFFHKKEIKLPENNHQNVKITSTKCKNMKTRSARQKVSFAKNDVYEFLSQSQTSDSDVAKDKDVAADIIEKLIEQGKVVVTRNRNGRPCITHRRKKIQKPKAQKNKTDVKNKKTKNTKKTTVLHIENNDILDDRDDNEHLPDFPVMLEDKTSLPHEIALNKNRNNVTASSDGTFSNLARSVLERQTKNQEAARKNLADGITARKILERYSSTPFKPQQKSSEPLIEAQFSPILNLNEKSKSITNALKRVSHLTSSLQEFSTFSETNKTQNTTAKTLVRPSTSNFMSLSSIGHQPEKSPQMGSLSSFSSNDSNAENEPPPTLLPSTSMHTKRSYGLSNIVNNENEVIHSARQSPNPRRTLTHRSPLKAINIIDVVTLPPYTGPSLEKSKRVENLKSKDNDDTNFFGFEEYIDEDGTQNTIENESLSSENASNKTSRVNITRKLKKLKKWHPKLTPLRRNAGNNSTITKNLFDDNGGNEKTNRNIKEMLCSTMVNENRSEQHTTNVSNSYAANSSDDSDDDFKNKSNEDKTAELFGDPETSFDHKSFHRTYERPFRRKRKLVHQYSDVFDSDNHTDDEEEDAHNKSIAENKEKRKKKRQCRDENQQNVELEKFAAEFNSMLKEAEDYEIIVE